MTKGVVLFEGPSQIDGAPIVCVATGFDQPSMNHKTGPMVQTWILRRDVSPEAAVADGSDVSVCGDCKLRGIVQRLPNGEQVNRYRGCYVFVGQAPQKVWDAWRAGYYLGQRETLNDLEVLLRGRMVRFGSYGDPCAVPIEYWRGAMLALIGTGGGWTGYTHQWQDLRFKEYRSLLMASVDSEAERKLASSMGWRTFRVAATGAPPAKEEFHCPASAEEGYRKTCRECMACDGSKKSGDQRPGVVIWPHGPPAAVKSFYRITSGASANIDHRKALTEADRMLLAALRDSGRASASVLAAKVGRGAQATATRLWHLRQMGLARRLSRGQYEACEVPE